MRRLRLAIGIVVAVIVTAGCSAPPLSMLAAKTPVRSVQKADHLVPRRDGAFYCKLTDEVVAGSDMAEHAGHTTAASSVHHGGRAQAAGGPHGKASHAEHGSRASSTHGTGHGPARVNLAGGGGHTASHECRPTAEERAAADRLVADTKAAIAKYEKVGGAMFAGYGPFGGPAKDRSQHYVNDEYRRDSGVLDADRVESLVYGWTDRHGIVLIGALYIMPKNGMHGPEVGGCLTQWHIHQAGDSRFGEGAELAEMLHVWIVDMPGGPFAAEPDRDYIRNL